MHFPEPYLKLYGVQPRKYKDPRVVGTLPREELLEHYRRSSGYWYHYEIPNVCYLPPIEMMTVGGPVVYMKGSLLARYFDPAGPGQAYNVEDAKRKLERLLAGDQGYIDDVRGAQQQVARRYHPDHVHPIFDRTFRQLITRPEVTHRQPAVLRVGQPPGPRQRVYLLFHQPGEHVRLRDSAYEPANALARSVSETAGALLADTDHEVVVTCFADQLPHAFGLLQADKHAGRLQFCVLNPEQLERRRSRPVRGRRPRRSFATARRWPADR